MKWKFTAVVFICCVFAFFAGLRSIQRCDLRASNCEEMWEEPLLPAVEIKLPRSLALFCTPSSNDCQNSLSQKPPWLFVGYIIGAAPETTFIWLTEISTGELLCLQPGKSHEHLALELGSLENLRSAQGPTVAVWDKKSQKNWVLSLNT